MKDPTSVMWAHACEMLAEAERLQRQFFIIGSRERRAAWEPPVDVYETEGEFVVSVALPGVKPSHIEIAVDGDLLVIAGDRVLPLSSALIRRLEIPHGRFERRLAMPASAKLVSHTLEDGCLVLTLRKGE